MGTLAKVTRRTAHRRGARYRAARAPVSLIRDAQARLGLSQENYAQILGVSVRTLSRWMTGATAVPDEDRLERLELVGDVLQAAERALAPEAVTDWFRAANPVLGDLRPIDLLQSRAGRERVKALLGQIRWGLPT